MMAWFFVFLAAVLCAADFPGPDELPPVKGLPDPLIKADGTPVTTPEQWNQRRAEILEMLATYEYGHMPPPPDNLRAENVATEPALDGAASLKKFTLVMGPQDRLRMEAGMFIPTRGKKPFPVIVTTESAWSGSLEEAARIITERGYIFAGYNRYDIDRDDADRSDGVHPLYADYDWATLAAWAWGASRLIDYLQTDPDVDAGRIVLTGHSRGGKTALWAAANDTRVAIAAPHASGCGGAGSFRILGTASETLDEITKPDRFPYWFQPRLREFVGKEERLPFDQHFLKALIAPRPLICLEGLADYWANPKGTEAMSKAAQPVFELLGAPKNNLTWYRTGGHKMTRQDWETLVAFADHFFFDKPITFPYNNFPAPH